MDELRKQLKENRPKISDSSVRTYSSIVSNLFRYMHDDLHKPLDGALEFFEKNPKKVLEFLKDKEGSKRKTILAALVVLTLHKEDVSEQYRKTMLDDARKYNDDEKDQEKSSSQKKNWISQEELKKIYDELAKDTKNLLKKDSLTPTEFQRLQHYVILSLYTLQPPRRLMDYTEMKLNNVDKEKDNYIEKKNMIFNKYKTSKFSGKEEVPMNPKLKYILDKWKKVNPSEYLLVGTNNKKLTSSQLQQRLNTILGRQASVNILRHSFLSDKYKDIDIRDMEKTATAMGHSKEQAMLYVKKE
jgi:integrase